ncbi:MAG TPA: hypothetical protein PKD34_01095 [Candidatus Doudnabacteria bacterium]|nr:hypothetical protein [Candidatus Doudnabacteria bacterium]
MNQPNGGIHVPESGPNQPGSNHRVKLLIILLGLLAGTLVFLATPYAERTLGVKLTSLFSGANLSKDDIDQDSKGGGGTFDCVTEPCVDPNEPVITKTGGGSFDCITAPCLHPELSILNPTPNSKWTVGQTYSISWAGASGSRATVEIEPYTCSEEEGCDDAITIANSVSNGGTVKWTVPTDIAETYIGGLSRLRVTLDGNYYTVTSVEIIRSGTGTPSPSGSYIYFPRNPLAVFRVEGNSKRPLPFPAHEVIACLGDNPALISVGTQLQSALPTGEPLFCNPPSGQIRPGNLRSGFPDSDLSSVYFIEGETRRPFPTSEIFHCLGYDFNNVHIANQREVTYRVGAPMTCDDINNPLQLLGESLPNGVVNVPYSAKFSATGGVKPYEFTLVDIQPRADAKMSTDGQLEATFSQAGTYAITVKVTDNSNDFAANSDQKTFPLLITSTGTGGGGGTGGSGQNCIDNSPQDLTALYRFYSSRDSDHYYSTSPTIPSGFVGEGITAYIYKTQVSGTVPMYQSYNPELKDHYYTTDMAGAQTFGYRLDGVVGYIYPNQVSGSNAMYRMYNNSARHYLMTTSTVERDAIASIGYAQQGTVGYFCGVPRPGSEIIPIYRLWSNAITDHFYTVDIFERDSALQRGYVSEGIAGHVYSVPGANRTAVYRAWSSRFTNHFYSTNEAEINNSGYAREGVLGYISTVPSTQQTQLYRLYNSRIGDHFYTTSTAERDGAVTGGYRFEGTMGYLP